MTPLTSVQEPVEQEVYQAQEINEPKLFPSSSGHMFGNYFTPGRTWSFKKNTLLDTRARRIFETTAMGCEHNAYPFQYAARG